MNIIIIYGDVMKLSDQKAGFLGRVLSLSTMPALMRKKTLSLGILPNTDIELIRFAPLGDPIQVRVRGFDLAISKAIAEHIILSQQHCESCK